MKLGGLGSADSKGMRYTGNDGWISTFCARIAMKKSGLEAKS